MIDLTINIDLGKRCAKCHRPGVVNETGICMVCISKRIEKIPRPPLHRHRLSKKNLNKEA